MIGWINKYGTNTILTKWLMLTLLVISYIAVMCPLIKQGPMVPHLPDSPWKEFITSVYSWENIRQTYVEGHSPEYLTTTCQGIKRQGKTKKLSCFEETKETCKLNATWYPGLVLGTEKNIHGKIGEIWINYFSWWYLPMLIF